MTLIFNFFKTFFTDKKINFYFFTLLIIIDFLLSIPFLHMRTLLAPLHLESTKIFMWISNNEFNILSVFTFYLIIQACILILTCIASYADTCFLALRDLLHYMIDLSIYFVLLLQLCNNLKVTSYGMFSVLEYYSSTYGYSFIGTTFTVSYLVTLLCLFLKVLAYFIHSSSTY